MPAVFKKIPIWFKMGILGSGITIAFSALIYGCEVFLPVIFNDANGSGISSGVVCLAMALASPIGPLLIIWESIPVLGALSPVSITVVSSIIWFIIGASYGWIFKSSRINK